MSTCCNVLNINGMNCHEFGCSEAWRDEKGECFECGCEFEKEHPHAKFCSDDCANIACGIMGEGDGE